MKNYIILKCFEMSVLFPDNSQILMSWQLGYGERHNLMGSGKAQPRGESGQLKEQVEMPRADRHEPADLECCGLKGRGAD